MAVSGPFYATISTSASGDTQLVAAVAGSRIVVLAYALSAAGAVAFKWRSAANDASGAMTLATGTALANSAGPAGDGVPVGLVQTNAGEALQINLSGAVAVGGHFSYLLWPN